MATPTEERPRWRDREPVKILLPLSALFASGAQTVAYLGYKEFYSGFGVRPEEVGYDYTSLLPRTIVPVAFLTVLTLIALSMLSLVLGLWRAEQISSVGQPAQAASEDSAAIARHARIGVFGGIVLVGVILLVPPHLLPALFVIAVVVAVALGHILARWYPPDRSYLARFVQPRTYRGGRRFIIMAAGAVCALNYRGEITWTDAVAFAALVYIVDRGVPIIHPAPAEEVEGGGTSRWLVGILGILVLAVVVTALVMVFVTQLSVVGDKAKDVRAGHPLRYSVANPLTLAEPRAQQVLVQWTGPRVPPPFVKGKEAYLIYLGQNNGTSVFFSQCEMKDAVYRLPMAMLVIRQPFARELPTKSQCRHPV
jgi:hypothetical protein